MIEFRSFRFIVRVSDGVARAVARAGFAASCVVVVTLAWGGIPGALAQQEPPSQIEERLREPARPRAKPPAVIPVPDRPEPPPGAERIEFVLNRIELSGNTALSTAQLGTQWQDALGTRISLTNVYEIAAAITVFYRNEGYILSRAIVPPQEIEKGVVEIEVIEGYIDNVIIDGEPTGRPAQLQTKIDAIKASRPLHVADMERYMLLINDLSGVSARSVLRPSPSVPGASELVIVLEETAMSASLSIDNRGTRFVGPAQATATFNLLNILGLYDATEVRLALARDFSFSESNELTFGSIKHSELITTEGTTLELQASRTDTEPGSTLAASEIEGEATRISGNFIHPFIRTRSENLTVKVGFNYLDTRTTILGAPFFKDRVRWVSAGGIYDFVDRLRGINLIGIEASQGVDVLGAIPSGTLDLSRQHGRSDFTKITADLVREQDLGTGFSLLAAAKGQYAFSQLLTSQEFGVGGADFGRGYDPFEISGDHGAAIKLELRFGGAADLAVLESYQLFGFYDIGAVWRIDEDREVGGVRDSASSIGAGARLNFTPNIFGSVEVAHPLTRRPTTNRDDGKKRPRVFFRITGRL